MGERGRCPASDSIHPEALRTASLTTVTWIVTSPISGAHQSCNTSHGRALPDRIKLSWGPKQLLRSTAGPNISAAPFSVEEPTASQSGGHVIAP